MSDVTELLERVRRDFLSFSARQVTEWRAEKEQAAADERLHVTLSVDEWRAIAAALLGGSDER